jgi:hypothetical protein
MSDKIHEEVINSWNSWKYDILDMNKSNWSKDDQLTLETIEQILNDELKNTIKLVSLEGEVRMLRKELNDRKTND